MLRPVTPPMTLFHVGIVVPQIAPAQAHLHQLLGVEWGPVVEIDALAVRDGAGVDTAVPNRLCYTTAGPNLELIEEVPGTVWTCNEYSNLHHIGFFVPGLAAEAGRLEGAACPMELCGRDGGRAPSSFSYHRDPLGLRLELVDEGLRPSMEEHLFRRP
jgi:Glyoxalase/Bleomycin resistance protein/Dioxygenase superfamily